MHCSGFKMADNMGNYFGRMYQARYLSGMVAGGMTKSKTIGYVAAFPIPEVIRGINAFALGVQAVNPEAVVRVVWTKTWYDPATEKRPPSPCLMSARTSSPSIRIHPALRKLPRRRVYIQSATTPT
jgi:phosphodiesterase/alkaline phosphatase D-like protein